jgi:hypothetical protein
MRARGAGTWTRRCPETAYVWSHLTVDSTVMSPKRGEARRTLYWQYNVPVKVDMSHSVLASARKMSDWQSKEDKRFGYKSSYN